jgi:hypothetical protein
LQLLEKYFAAMRKRPQRTALFGKNCKTSSPLRQCELNNGGFQYPLHRRLGETVPIVRRLTRYGVELVVIVLPDGSLAQFPAWTP